MFFVLSKVVWFFIQPLNLAILGILAGLILALTGRRRLGLGAALSAFVILAAASWTSLGALIISPLENRFVRPDPLPIQVDGIIVLGGGLEGAINQARGGYEMNGGGDRFVEAAALARRYPDAKILVSGGMGTVILDGEGDADTAPRLLGALGVSADRLILENRSRNTAENAEFAKDLAKPQPGQKWLLITSGFHMPRSVGLFRKVGFPIIPWPADYRTTGNEGIWFFRDNEIDALQTTTVAVREWIGLVAYYLSGRIDTIFPGPEG